MRMSTWRRTSILVFTTAIVLGGGLFAAWAQNQSYTNGTILQFLDNTGATTQSMFVFGDSSNRLNLGAGNFSRMSITPAGNVGIGTMDPAGRFEVSGGNLVVGNNGVVLFRDSTGSLANPMFFGGDSSNRLIFGAGNTTRMRVTSTGDVEIISGNQTMGNSHFLFFLDSTGARTNSMFVGSDSSNRLHLGAGNNTRMTISSSGNVGIGTVNPAAQFHVVGNAQVDGNIAAKYQDVAEWVKTRTVMAPGTVVSIDPQDQNQVLQASAPYDLRVAGVVSDKPGILLGEAGVDRVKVAQSGRVKVKVDASYGSVTAGDLLVTSPTPGHAMRSTPVDMGGTMIHRPGTLLGKALEPLREGKGEILVLLTLQ